MKRLVNHKTFINNLFPYILSGYFVLSFLPNITYLSFAFSNSIINFGFRGLISILLFVYFVIASIANQTKPKKELIILAVVLIALTFVSLFNSLFENYHYVFIDAYNRYNNLTITIGLVEIFSYLGDNIFSILMMFMMFAVLKTIVKSCKHSWIPFLVEIILSLIAIVFSLIFEGSKYLSFLKMELDVYSNDIKSFFYSKNSFGVFLYQSVLFSSLFVFIGKKKIFIAPLIVSMIVLIFTMNKSSMFASIVFLSLILFLYLIKLYKTKKKISIILLSTIFTLFILFFVLINIPSLQKFTIIKMLNKYIFDQGEGSVSHRLELLYAYSNNVSSQSVFFGYGPSLDYQIKVWCLVERYYFYVNSLHNGFINLMAKDGITFLIIYLGLLLLTIKRVWGVRKTDFIIFSITVSTIASFVFFSFFESAYLFISTSPNTLLISISVLYSKEIFHYEKSSI